MGLVLILQVYKILFSKFWDWGIHEQGRNTGFAVDAYGRDAISLYEKILLRRIQPTQMVDMLLRTHC